jgi:hypothetical protein
MFWLDIRYGLGLSKYFLSDESNHPSVGKNDTLSFAFAFALAFTFAFPLRLQAWS